MAPEVTAPAIEVRGICKRYGAVLANKDVSLAVARGSIHGIVGENGAGKSTLMGILFGLVQADSGQVLLNGQAVQLRSSQQAIAHGIGMVHQHFMLVEEFSVLDNVLLGFEGNWAVNGRAAVRARMADLAHTYGLRLNADAKVKDLSVGDRQRLEIVKALVRQARVLILDEPTAVLTPMEAQQLFAVLRQLQATECTVILISHKLKEVMAMTDTVTVMRQGAVVSTRATAQTNAFELGELMVGRQMLPRQRQADARKAAVLLRAYNISVSGAGGECGLRGVSLSLHAGEIVGVAGVSGNGQSELLAALAGLQALSDGRIEVLQGDQPVCSITPTQKGDPVQMRRSGVAHVPEDRQAQGLVMDFSAWESAALGYQHEAKYQKGPFLNSQVMKVDCAERMAELDVRPANPLLSSAAFSGGNQQKLILARELHRQPRVLLVGQPTRGVDIGAIERIHARLCSLRQQGAGVLLVSSELDEIMALADRVLVMVDGCITGELAAGEANERLLGQLMGAAAGLELGLGADRSASLAPTP